jgi:hypothetical protein
VGYKDSSISNDDSEHNNDDDDDNDIYLNRLRQGSVAKSAL